MSFDKAQELISLMVLMRATVLLYLLKKRTELMKSDSLLNQINAFEWLLWQVPSKANAELSRNLGDMMTEIINAWTKRPTATNVSMSKVIEQLSRIVRVTLSVLTNVF